MRMKGVVLITDNNRQLPSTTDNYRQQADNYRQQAHNYRQQADNYRQQADNYRQQAEKYRQQANTYFYCILIVICMDAWLFLRRPKYIHELRCKSFIACFCPYCSTKLKILLNILDTLYSIHMHTL